MTHSNFSSTIQGVTDVGHRFAPKDFFLTHYSYDWWWMFSRYGNGAPDTISSHRVS